MWDLLDLLLVPLAIAIVAFLLNSKQRERELEIAREQRERELEIAREQKERDYALAQQRGENTALQEYLSQMANLLIDQKLLSCKANGERPQPHRVLARARTLSVLWQLDKHRKRNVLGFLQEAGVIDRDSGSKGKGIIELQGADFTQGYLCDMELASASLDGADLKEANLCKANLSKANLGGAELGRAKLEGANLSGASLRNATLYDKYAGPDETKTNLTGADLTGADLEGATGLSEEELHSQALSLKGAIMPNGQKYEVWHKDREGRMEGGGQSELP